MSTVINVFPCLCLVYTSLFRCSVVVDTQCHFHLSLVRICLCPYPANLPFHVSQNEVSLQKRCCDVINVSYDLICIFLFTDWLVASGHRDKLEFEKLDAKDLVPLLREYYYCVRTKEGERYSKSAYKNLRAGLHRYLQSPPNNKLFNILRDREFKPANIVFESYMVKIREEGKDINTSKPMIEPEDVALLYESLHRHAARLTIQNLL